MDTNGVFQTLADGTTAYVDLDYATEMTKATAAWAATAASPIPEPGTFILFAISGMVLMFFRKHLTS